MGNLAEAKTDIMPDESTTKIRRIITGHNEKGEAIFIEDADCPNRFVMGGNSLFVDTEIWKIENTPDSNEGECADPASSFTFTPPKNGNICRILEIPPDASLSSGDEEVKPLFHRTASIDYAFVIKGEVYAILDKQEKRMEAGDMLIQRGTIHAWSNRSSESCLILFVLCGAKELQGLPVL